MAFPPAQYFIYGSDSFTERPVSRSAYEDHSLWPKQIWLLPEGTRGLVPWIIVKSNSGYVFQSKGAPTGAAEGAVVAIVNQTLDPYISWIVEPATNDQDVFRIRTHDRKYWTVEEERGRVGHRIVLRNKGEGAQHFRIGLDADPQSHLFYGKRQKKFCS